MMVVVVMIVAMITMSGDNDADDGADIYDDDDDNLIIDTDGISNDHYHALFTDATTGDTTDWTFGVLGVIHSYCVELRPKGHPGFILPPDKIIPVGQETFAGLKALARNMDY